VSQTRANDSVGRYAAAATTGAGMASSIPPPPPSSALAKPASRDSLADLLERVLDKGLVIAGDIKVNLLDIELLTVKIRLLIASADKAREMGIDWWEHDPQLSSGARERKHKLDEDRERDALRRRVEELESRLTALLEHQPASRNGGSASAAISKTSRAGRAAQ